MSGENPRIIETVPIGEIRLNSYNPNTMDGEIYRALLSDMEQGGTGSIDPILVRPLEEGYEVVDGEHRLRAARQLGWKEIRARVRNLTLEQAMTVSYRKNRERGAFDALKEGRLFKWWHDPPPEGKGLTLKQIHEKFGVSEATISKRISIAEKVSKKAIEHLNPQKEVALSAPKVSDKDDGYLAPVPLEAGKLELLSTLPVEEQVEVAKKISTVALDKAREIVKEKQDELKLEAYRRRSEERRLEKRRSLEEGGYVVVLEEERDWLKHRNVPRMDGETVAKCVACPRPAVLLKRISTSTEPICADGPCWLKTMNEIHELRVRREEEFKRRLLEQQSKVLEAGDGEALRILLFLVSLRHRPGYLAEENAFDRWRPVAEMPVEEVSEWLRRVAVETLVRPAEPGDTVDTRQMLNWAVNHYGLDGDYLFPKEGV